MNRFTRIFGRFRAGVDPSPETLAKVAERVEATHTRMRLCRETLAPLREDPPARIWAIRQRLMTTRSSARRRRFAPVVIGSLVLVAIAGVLGRPPAPAALASRLDARERHDDALTPSVALEYTGRGTVGGTVSAPAITWDEGTLRVEVEPGAGVALTVETPEAHVRVIGTIFAVSRDLFGTRVTVERGHVAVECTGQADEVTGAPGNLGAGESLLCLPARAAGLLGRARAQVDRGDPPETVLGTVTLGLAAAPDPNVRGELRAIRVVTLAKAGRFPDARAEADALLAEGGGLRRADIARLAGQLAMREGGCAAALPYIEAIPAESRLPADEAARVACTPAPEPP